MQAMIGDNIAMTARPPVPMDDATGLINSQK
jgi:hypothetical protein